MIDAAFDHGEPLWSYGAEIRGAFGSKPWSVVGAAGARTPVTLTLNDGFKAEIIRFPLDGGMRLTSYRWRFRPWLVLGGSAIVTGILGQDVVAVAARMAMGLGALVMAGRDAASDRARRRGRGPVASLGTTPLQAAGRAGRHGW